MSPLFGHKDDQDDQTADNVAALNAEVDRLEALSLSALAAEVMARGFGPGSPGGRSGQHRHGRWAQHLCRA
ncbi:MAG TPA: hypothetical protein VGF70_10375 [Solirubrobacteraceae bacterium]